MESKQINVEPNNIQLNDEEEDGGITLVDVLEEEAQLEEDANAVLGGSDDKNCTYSSVCNSFRSWQLKVRGNS